MRNNFCILVYRKICSLGATAYSICSRVYSPNALTAPQNQAQSFSNSKPKIKILNHKANCFGPTPLLQLHTISHFSRHGPNSESLKTKAQKKEKGKKTRREGQTPRPPDTYAAAAAEMAAGDGGRAPPAQSLVESFCAVTSATPEEAAFFLESHNWVLESAVRSFYDSADADPDADADGPDPPPHPPPAAADDGADSDDEDYEGGGDEDEDDEDYVGDGDDEEDAALAAAAAAADERRTPPKRQKRSHNARGGSGSGSGSVGANGRGNVQTLSDLGGGRTGSGSDGGECSEDEEWAPRPELYTGGEKRGMVVRDRSTRKNNADEIFKQAKRKGAKQGPFEARRKSSSSRSLSGTGRRLTGETVQPDTPQPPENIVHNIYFWSNGFTVDDGPLRSFDDPENASFLESIKNSECPTELEPANGRSKVNVNLVRKEEKCPEPVKLAASFQGGRTLGSPSDNSAPSDITSAAAASSTATATKTMTLTVDDSLPSTSLQIRFADGSRVVARFNTSHTIGDVRAFIDAKRPGEASEYTLQVGFPPEPLDDVTKTIEEAGVANSVIIQKV